MKKIDRLFHLAVLQAEPSKGSPFPALDVSDPQFRKLYGQRLKERARKERESSGGKRIPTVRRKTVLDLARRSTRESLCKKIPAEVLYERARERLAKKLSAGTPPAPRTAKEAREATCGLGETTKTGPSYGLPPWSCQVGSKLACKPGTACSMCYARKGQYVMCDVRLKHACDLAALDHPHWKEGMILLLRQLAKKLPFFRWHDSGDLRDARHLEAIADIARKIPEMSFWLPTREYSLVASYYARHGDFPKNLTVRVSTPYIDEVPPERWPNASSVHSSCEVAARWTGRLPDPGRKRRKGERVFICPITDKCKDGVQASGKRKRKDAPVDQEPPPDKNCHRVRLGGRTGCQMCWRRGVKWVSYQEH